MWYNGAGGDFLTHLLVVDDEVSILELIKNSLGKDGYLITVCQNADDVDIKKLHFYDLILLDVMMPGTDGFEFCKQIRNMVDCPILFLTAKTLEEDILFGLGIGADDYITKPFNSREVVARIKAVLRRAGAQEKQEGRSRVEYDGLTIDMEEYQVVAFGQKMTFTAKEMELLWCLATNPGKAFSRNQLLETIWGYSYYGDTRTVDTHIKRIRQKLNIPENSKWDITTIWGVGYKFEVKSE